MMQEISSSSTRQGKTSKSNEYNSDSDEQRKTEHAEDNSIKALSPQDKEAVKSDKVLTKEDLKDKRFKVRPDKARFPICITWTMLPGMSHIMPLIGHTGIADSRGVIHDFAGPYYISIDDFAFGETHKYVKLDLEGVTLAQFDEAIRQADVVYRERMHNICCDNCHSHVARVLNILKYKGRTNYTMIDIWWMCLVKSNYVSAKHVVLTYILYILATIGFALSLIWRWWE